MNCCKINEWGVHGFTPVATTVCCHQWSKRESKLFSKNAFESLCKVSYFCLIISKTEFCQQILIKLFNTKSEIHPAGVELFHVGIWTDRRMMKLIYAFHNFCNLEVNIAGTKYLFCNWKRRWMQIKMVNTTWPEWTMTGSQDLHFVQSNWILRDRGDYEVWNRLEG
jgi:hypothetical protein